jgi:hypothetical protein
MVSLLGRELLLQVGAIAPRQVVVCQFWLRWSGVILQQAQIRAPSGAS